MKNEYTNEPTTRITNEIKNETHARFGIIWIFELIFIMRNSCTRLPRVMFMFKNQNAFNSRFVLAAHNCYLTDLKWAKTLWLFFISLISIWLPFKILIYESSTDIHFTL